MEILSFLAFDPSILLEPDMVIRLILQGVLFCCSFFFSGSETALFSLSPLDIRKLHSRGHRHAGILEALLDQPRRLIISLLCGNELVNIVATANMAGILFTLYGAEDAGLINLIVMFPLLLLLGEITPKTIAVNSPVKISTVFVARPLGLWVRVVTPLCEAVRLVSDLVTTTIVGSEVSKSNILNRDEFRTIIDSIEEEDAVISTTERVILNNLLECSDVEVVEIMTPRTKIDFVNAGKPLDMTIERFIRKGHTRMPVWQRHRDNIIGVLHVDDVADLVMNGADLNTISIEDIVRKPVVVPLTKTVDEVFDVIQERNTNSALVLNEYGGVEGMITARDVLNFIFSDVAGDLLDADNYRVGGHNSYEVPGDMTLNDFDDISNFGIEDPRMTTIGGVAFRHFDRVPEVGDRVFVDGVTISVLEMADHRIAKLKVVKGIVEPSLEDFENPDEEQLGKVPE